MLPLAVKKNKFGQRVADISVTEHYRQIEEEVLEAHENAVISDHELKKTQEHKDTFNSTSALVIYKARQAESKNKIQLYKKFEAEELADIITACITRLEIIGYDAEKRDKLYKAVNDKNRKRGYLEE